MKKVEFFRIYKLGKKAVAITFAINLFDKDDTHIALCSGKEWSPVQYLLLDYDRSYVPSEWKGITYKYEYRRSLIVESSPKKYQLISFTPTPVGEILEIMFNSTAKKHCDMRHCMHMLTDGYTALRLSRKKEFPDSYPRLRKVINNPDGKNKYEYNTDKIYRRILIEGVDEVLKDSRIFRRLIEQGVLRE